MSRGASGLRGIRQSQDIIGLDIDAMRLARSSGKRVRGVRADCERAFPFKDDSFDVVITNQVIEHLRDSDHFLSEIRRILRPNGYAIISTTNLASPHNSLLLLAGYQPIGLQVSRVQVGNPLKGSKTHGHVNCMTVLALRDLLMHHGFSIASFYGTGFYPFPLSIARLITPFLGRFAVIQTYKVVPRKGERGVGTREAP